MPDEGPAFSICPGLSRQFDEIARADFNTGSTAYTFLLINADAHSLLHFLPADGE